MIQLTAEQQHVTDGLVNEIVEGRTVKLPRSLCGFMSAEALTRYLGVKADRLKHKIVESIEDDVLGDRVRAARDIAMPFGWTYGEDMDVDPTIAAMYNDTGTTAEEAMSRDYGRAGAEAVDINNKRRNRERRRKK